MKIMILFFFFIFEFARQFFAVNWWSVYLHLFEKGCLDSVLIPPPWTNAVLMFICITNPPNSATHETRIFSCCVRAMVIHWSRTKMCLSWTEPNKMKVTVSQRIPSHEICFQTRLQVLFSLTTTSWLPKWKRTMDLVIGNMMPGVCLLPAQGFHCWIT